MLLMGVYHGTAVGSPVSVVEADQVMEHVESRTLSSFSPSPHFQKQFVDNTCCALQTDLIHFSYVQNIQLVQYDCCKQAFCEVHALVPCTVLSTLT